LETTAMEVAVMGMVATATVEAGLAMEGASVGMVATVALEGTEAWTGMAARLRSPSSGGTGRLAGRCATRQIWR
jgi:hypothetical protein